MIHHATLHTIVVVAGIVVAGNGGLSGSDRVNSDSRPTARSLDLVYAIAFQKEMIQVLKEIKMNILAQRLENRKGADVSKVNQKVMIEILRGLYDRCDKTATKVGFIEKRIMGDFWNSREFERLVRQAKDVKEESLVYLEEREAPWPRLLQDCISNVNC